ncbi:hypothetical protein [Mucilaginibacter sp.]|uniref:hypothetical protein n=1 Tax=Mucilaginibacter sp. TaxID=1882438 RepID=UPI00261BC9C5|nr:hypothetical protein [Mucilaginibacter sp.]
MEKFEISVTNDNQSYHFEVRDYMHHEGDQCKFEVFEDGKFIASFEPDGYKGLHICKNPGIVGEELLHLVAEELESYNF